MRRKLILLLLLLLVGGYTLVQAAISGGVTIRGSSVVSVGCPVGYSAYTAANLYGAAWNGNSLANLTFGSASNHVVSIRFKASFTDTLPSVRIYIKTTAGYGGGTFGSLKMELRTDDGTANHFPTNTVLATHTISDPGVPSTDVMRLFTFDSVPNVTAGTIYHIVITQMDADPITNFSSIDDIFMGTPLSPEQPGFADNDFAILSNLNGSGWVLKTAHSPIVSLNYGNNPSQGQTYNDVLGSSGLTQITGANQIRETITPTTGGKIVQDVHFRVVKIGAPGDLTARLETSDGTLIEEVTVTAASIPSTYSWVSFTFTQKRILAQGQGYNIILKTPTAAAGNRYETFPLAFGGGSNQFEVVPQRFDEGFAQISTDTGSTWKAVTGVHTHKSRWTGSSISL